MMTNKQTIKQGVNVQVLHNEHEVSLTASLMGSLMISLCLPYSYYL